MDLEHITSKDNQKNNSNCITSYIDNNTAIKEELDYLEIEYTSETNVRELLESFKKDSDTEYEEEDKYYQITDLRKVEKYKKGLKNEK